MKTLSCFKTYDVRGIVPDELNPDIAYRIGRAIASELECHTMVVGHDIRLSGVDISDALSKGLLDSGVDVTHIGLCGTEEVYFAVQELDTDGGICVTASHNPANYNGMKIVGKGASPISRENGLSGIQRRAEQIDFIEVTGNKGTLRSKDLRHQYVKRLLKFIDPNALAPLKVVVNAGNGGAGLVLDTIEPYLPFDLIKLNHQPDGRFPNGVPNPLLKENHDATSQAVIKHKADLGVAWDGDFDRCFFFDEKGQFIDGYYIVGLLAQSLLATNPITQAMCGWSKEAISLSRRNLNMIGHTFSKIKTVA